MKKQFLVFIAMASILLLGAAKDPYDSFDKLSQYKIGFIVAGDTTLAPTGSYATAWYRYLKGLGFNVIKVDTNYCDQATYDGVHNWTTLDIAFFPPISDYDSCHVDTSIANGIGELPVIDMHKSENIADSLGLASSTEYLAGIDTLKFGYDSTAYQLNYTTTDSVARIRGTLSLWGLADEDSATYPTNNLLWARHDGVDSLLIAKYDTLNNEKRMYFSGAYPVNYDSYQYYSAFDDYYIKIHPLVVLNKTLSLMLDTNTDSLFYFASAEANTDGNASLDPIRDWLEINGHRVEQGKVGYTTKATYNGTDGWDGADAVYLGAPGNSAIFNNFDSLVTRGLAIRYAQNFIGGTRSGIGTQPDIQQDSLVATSTHPMMSGGSGIEDTLVISTLHEPLTHDYVSYFSGASGLDTIYSTKYRPGSSKLALSVAMQPGTKKFGIMHDFGAGVYSASKYDWTQWTNDFWGLLSNIFGYMSEPFNAPPTNVTGTVLSSDSVKVTWTDNETEETAYGIYVYEAGEETNFWFVKDLAASTEIDTIPGIWPPNARVIFDVAVIRGTTNDTLLSGSPDTVYTSAITPPAPLLKTLSDSTLSMWLNNYLFVDEFADTTDISDWTQTTGTWDNEYPNHILEVESAGGEIVQAYSSSIKDAFFYLSYQLSDSVVFSSQNITWHIIQNQQALGDDGYNIYAEYDSLFLRRADNGVHTNIISAAVEGENSHWHTVKVKRAWDGSPVDTATTYTLYWDGTSKGSVVDETYSAVTHTGIEASHSGIHFDNYYIYNEYPSANHRLTTYAVQDSTAGTYFDPTVTPSVSTASEVWATYADWDSTLTDTLGSLTPGTSYKIRTKAISGR